MPWKVFKEGDKFAIHKMNGDGSQGELVPPLEDSQEKADARVKAMYANSKDMMTTERVYDAFVATKPGEPYRLLPFGQIKRAKGGQAHDLTPEMAARFHLPHFKPPVKLGSHEDTTPAGGHIIGLEVRADGLYAIPEWNDKGSAASTDGSYRYHSPEIIWEDGAIENATTGEWINGPLIVGDALLHVPALGEATALYTSQIKQGVETMPEETVQVPKGLWEQLSALFKPATQQPAQEPPKVDPEVYAATVRENDALKAQLKKEADDKLHAETVTKLSAELQDKKFGKEFDGKAAPEAAEVLAGMTKEQQEWVMTRLAAMSKRIDYSKIIAEIGSDGANTITDPRQAFAAAIETKMKAAKVSYDAAYKLVKDESPDLFKAYAEYVPGKAKGE